MGRAYSKMWIVRSTDHPDMVLKCQITDKMSGRNVVCDILSFAFRLGGDLQGQSESPVVWKADKVSQAPSAGNVVPVRAPRFVWESQPRWPKATIVSELGEGSDGTSSDSSHWSPINEL
jgi:hypothetical protein